MGQSFLFPEEVILNKNADTDGIILSDVKADDPYAAEIYYFVKNKFLARYKGDEFKPNYILSRSQFITLLISLTNFDKNPYSGYYLDVPQDYWASVYIEASVSRNLIDVPDNRKFYPRALQKEKEALSIINKLFPIDNYSGQVTGDQKENNQLYNEDCFLTRGKMVEILSKTKRFKEGIQQFKEKFKIPKKDVNDDVKHRFLDDNIKKYLANGTGSDDLKADIKNIKSQNDVENMIDEKLSKAFRYIHEWKYYEAIKEIDDVLKVDQENTLALMRRGSAYYLLENYDKAREDWLAVLKYDSNNEIVKEFLAKEGKIEDQSYIYKRIELEKVLEDRLKDVIEKKIAIKDISILISLEIGAEMISPQKEKALLPGIPVQSDSIYEKYFIKELNVNIKADEGIDAAKYEKIPEIVSSFFPFPVALNKNLFLGKANLKDNTNLSISEQYYISEKLAKSQELWEQRLKEYVGIMQSRIESNNSPSAIAPAPIGSQPLISDAQIKLLSEPQARLLSETQRDLLKTANRIKEDYTSINIQVAGIRERLKVELEKQKSFNINHMVSIGNTVAIIGMMMLFFVLFRKTLPAVSSGVGKLAAGAEGQQGAAEAAPAAAMSISGRIETAVDDDEGIKEMSIRKSTSMTAFFEFVDDDNIFKLKILMLNKYKQKKLTIEQIAIICSYLPASMSNIILSQFEDEEQAEIIAYLVYSNQYSMDVIAPLEKSIKEQISCLVGGKDVVLGLLNELRDKEKTALTKVLGEKYPDLLEEIRDMIVLFEDILLTDKDSLKKIFYSLDPYIIAAGIMQLEEGDKNQILSLLTESMKDMVNQVLELKKSSLTKVEIINAQEHILKVAKNLAKQGSITLIKKTFGNIDSKESQEDIDNLIAQSMAVDQSGEQL